MGMNDTIGHHSGKDVWRPSFLQSKLQVWRVECYAHASAVYNKLKYVCEAKPYGCFREWLVTREARVCGFVFPWDDNQRFRNKNAESCTSRKACARVSSYREAVFMSNCSCQKIFRPVIGVPMGVRKHEPIITFATDWTLGITVKYFSIPRQCTVSSDSLVVFAGCALLRNPSERYVGDTPMRSGISVVKMYPLELISSITSLM